MSAARHDLLERLLDASIGWRAQGVIAGMLLLACHAFAQTPLSFDGPRYTADEVKAVFLYHFGTYVQWPENAANAAGAIAIAVVEADELADTLRTLLVGRTIGDRPVLVRAISDVSEVADEQIVFIGASMNARLDEILTALQNRPVLVVTDSPDGLRDGATINFLMVDGRVRFEISLRSAQMAGLMLSSRLLSAAIRVVPDEQARAISQQRLHAAKARPGLPGLAQPRV